MIIWNRNRLLATAIMLTFLSYGCAATTDQTTQVVQPAGAASQQHSEHVYTGPVVGKSDKAKTISIKVGKDDAAQTMMLKFDDNTKGIKLAKKDDVVIATWEQRGDDKFVTEIKPKLAKLPQGVSEIKVDELYALLSADTPMTLVDARPEARYDQAHLPGAISIPVPKLKKMKEQALPDDKNKLLAFYCGGPT